MMCFRDKTYCSAECANTDCHRQFTAADEAAAERRWGGPDAPVAWSDFSASCPNYQPAERADV